MITHDDLCDIHQTPLDIDAIRGVICPTCDAENDAAAWPYILAILVSGLVSWAVAWMMGHA